MGPPEHEMRGNILQWPKSSTLEYAIHGKFQRSADDFKGLHSAYWVPLRKLILSLGKDLVTEKLKEYNEEEERRVREEAVDECIAAIAEEEADAAVAAERAAARAASGGAAGGAAARAAAGATGATSPEMA